MIGLTPLDAALDAFGAQFCGAVIGLLFGSLRGVIVIGGVLVLAWALFTLAFGFEIREALARVLKLGVVIWVFGWLVPTDVQVWMSGTRYPSSRATSGDTSGWLNAIVSALDAVTVELLDLVQGLGAPSGDLTSQQAYVYGLTAITEATTFDIQDPRMREGVQTFFSLCLPRAYEAIAQGRATSFFDWIANGADTPIVTASEAAITLPGPGGATFGGLTTCRQMHDVLAEAYVASYQADRGAHFSDPIQAERQSNIAAAALSNAGYTGGESVSGLAWRRWLSLALNTVRTANGLNPAALGALKATEWITGNDLSVLYSPARATGRGETIADLTLGIVGWFDRVLDGAFTTKLMAITLPLVLAVVRCLLYLLFPFAWLSLGLTRRGTPFVLWLGAVAWTKAQYVVMTLMVELELFLGRTFQMLKETPLGSFPFESVARMESALSLVFAIATVTGMAITAAIFFRAAGPLASVGRASAGTVLGAAASLAYAGRQAAGAAAGGVSGGAAGASRSLGGGLAGARSAGSTPDGSAGGSFPRGGTPPSSAGGFRVSVSPPSGSGGGSGQALPTGGAHGRLGDSRASHGPRALPPAPPSASGAAAAMPTGSGRGLTILEVEAVPVTTPAARRGAPRSDAGSRS